MVAQTSMLHVRIDEQLKQSASDVLAEYGLTISDAVKILLTRTVREGGLPVALTADPQAYDAWFREKVKEAMKDERPRVPHEEAIASVRAALRDQRK